MSESTEGEPRHSAFQFEGDDVTDFAAQLPAIKMPTDEPFQRGTILDLRVRVRVRSVRHDETRAGDIVRTHMLALEECVVAGVLTPAMIRAAIEAEAAAAAEQQFGEEEHLITEQPGPEDDRAETAETESADPPEDVTGGAVEDDWDGLSPEARAERRRQDVESWDRDPAAEAEAGGEPLVVGEPDVEPATAGYPSF